MERRSKQIRSAWAWALLILLAQGAMWLAPLLGGTEWAVEADSALMVEEGRKLVALTFDDGPKGKWTTKLLDGLGERGAKATFFVIGAQVADDPDKVRRMIAEGHEVGIHTYDHSTALTDLCRADFDAQVGRTRTLLTELLGDRTFLVRPPYGAIDESVRTWADAPLILWSVDTEDWAKMNVEQEVACILDEVEDGDIILMHDIFPESVEAALQAVDALHERGYYFVTVSQLFEERGIAMEKGKSYSRAPAR